MDQDSIIAEENVKKRIEECGMSEKNSCVAYSINDLMGFIKSKTEPLPKITSTDIDNLLEVYEQYIKPLEKEFRGEKLPRQTELIAGVGGSRNNKS
jgi:hypothetical protein